MHLSSLARRDPEAFGPGVGTGTLGYAEPDESDPDRTGERHVVSTWDPTPPIGRINLRCDEHR
jgi:hypothetical protein